MQEERFADVSHDERHRYRRAILFIVTRPWHVAINEVLIRPTAAGVRFGRQ